MEPQVGEKRPLDDESSAMVEAQVGEAQVGEKRPLDDVRGCSSRVLPPPQDIQVESINQAIAQHQAVIQTQSDISQVLGTVSTSLTALVSALDGGYPADRQTVQAVVSQVETLRAIQNTSVQSLHTSCATLQNILAHATHDANAPPPQQGGAPAQAPPPALTPMLQPPPMLAPPMLQPQMMQPQQPQMMQPQQMQMQPQQMPMQPQMYAPQMQMQMPMQPPQMMYQPQQMQPQQMQPQLFAPQQQQQQQPQPQPEQMMYGGPGDAIADAVFGTAGGGPPYSGPVGLPAALSGAVGGFGDHGDRKKTSLCKNFPQGTCNFGDRCSFAHGEADLRVRAAPQAYPPQAYAPQAYAPAPPPQAYQPGAMLPSLVGNYTVDMRGQAPHLQTLTLTPTLTLTLILT